MRRASIATLSLELVLPVAASGTPDNHTLGRIRGAIIDRPDEWRRITTAKAFRETFELMGESLKRPPRGYDPGHPLMVDLKRKDYVAVTSFSEDDANRPDFLNRFTAIARKGSAFVGFLSQAVGVPY